MEQSREQMAALAAYVDTQRGPLLTRWRTATEHSTESTVASKLSRQQFEDHIPHVLAAFSARLRAWPEPLSAQAQREETEQEMGHGLQRWQQGYQLRDLTHEWGTLQRCLMDTLESYAGAHPDLEPRVERAARRALADLCWAGISTSTTKYWRLHQTDAAGHVSDLKQALSTVSELERARADAWREAAHDLRGSVTLVSGATSLLQDGDLPLAKQSKYNAVLQQGVSSLHSMLNDLLSLARLEAGHEQRQVAAFNAAVLLKDFCATSLPLAQAKGLYLRAEGPDSLPVEGDRVKVIRIVQNLLLNAIKYTQRGGVTVSWDVRQDQDTAGWLFCVQDTGPGLAAGPGAPLAQQLYDATQSAHEADAGNRDSTLPDRVAKAPTLPAQSHTLPPHQRPGEGVGLSIVKHLCELLDASIELETNPGQGSTFQVKLPSRYDEDAR